MATGRFTVFGKTYATDPIGPADLTFDVVDVDALPGSADLPVVAHLTDGISFEEISIDSVAGSTLTVTRSGSPQDFPSTPIAVTVSVQDSPVILRWPGHSGTLATLDDLPTGTGEISIRHNNSTDEGADDVLDFLDSNTIDWAFNDTGSEIQIDAEITALIETGGPTVLPFGVIGASQVLIRSTISTVVGAYPSEVLDLIDSTPGAILYRSSGSGASGWVSLAPGPDTGRVLVEHGAGAPVWTDDATVGAVPLHSAQAAENTGRPFAPISTRQWGLLTAPTNSGTTMTAVGDAGQASSGGTQTFGTRSTASFRQSLTRQTNTTGTGANSTAGWTMHGNATANQIWRGNATGLGGFFWEAVFAIATTISTMSIVVGPASFNAAPTSYTNPTSQVDLIFIGCLSTDSNLNIYSNDGAGNIVSARDLGPSFAKSITTNVYHVIFKCLPNASTIDWYVSGWDGTTLISDNGQVTTQLPTSTVFLNGVIHISNLGSGTPGAVALDVMSMYEESVLAG